ncbi:MAG: YeeE/YedE family protein [Betaproteobacteria bacterium]|nr:YeeE/YedE family protein [Betaproteobacteria bacterium]
MHDFTPVPALIGGVLIGLASVWLLAANGRIAGISNILHGLFELPFPAWRAWFIGGLLVAGVAWQLATRPAPLHEGFPLGWAAAAGLLVGFGTRLGSGCTSGHGVCGLGRLSARSLVAVVTFMVTGTIAVYVMRHVLKVAS